jgi:hypothetical protein
MHAAPSVTYPVGRSAFAGAAALVAALAGFAATLAWTLQSPAPGWRHALAFACLLATAGAAAAAWLRSPRGRLHYSGTGWQWEGEGGSAPGQAVAALDLQSRMLLRWRGEDGLQRWLWVERASDASHWDALRRAVYSRASAPIPTFSPRGKESPPTASPPAAEQ